MFRFGRWEFEVLGDGSLGQPGAGVGMGLANLKLLPAWPFKENFAAKSPSGQQSRGRPCPLLTALMVWICPPALCVALIPATAWMLPEGWGCF